MSEAQTEAIESTMDVTQESTALTTLPRADLIFVPGGAEASLSMIEERARKDAAKLDAQTEKGRKAIGSLVYKIRRLKTSGDDAGKELKADYLAKINPIDAERRIWRERMDALAEEIDRPVAEFKAAETAYILGQEGALFELAAFGVNIPIASPEIDARLAELENSPLLARDWKGYRERAQEVAQSAFNALKVARVEAVARENAAEAARVETLRLQAEREAEIARQAAEAARVEAERIAAEEAARVAQEAEEARVAAEQAAQAERERIEREAREAAAAAEAQRARLIEEAAQARLAAKREAERVAEAAEAERLRLVRQAEQEAAAAAERERLAAEALAEAERQRSRLAAEKEASRTEAHVRAITYIAERWKFGYDASSEEIAARLRENWLDRDFEEFTDEAKQATRNTTLWLNEKLGAAKEREEAEAEATRIAEAQRIADAEAAAAERERQRAAAAEAETLRLTAIREADKAHRGKINRETLADLVGLGLSDEHGRAVVAALAKKTIRHVTIAY